MTSTSGTNFCYPLPLPVTTKYNYRILKGFPGNGSLLAFVTRYRLTTIHSVTGISQPIAGTGGPV